MRKKEFNTKYSPEFKISCIIDMRTNHLSYNETCRKYFNSEKGKESNDKSKLKLWERIYLEEGEAGFYIERRGRTRKKDNPNKGRQRKNKYKSYKGQVGKIAPNILERDFKATKPFEKLATDVTEFAVCDEKVYLSPILDMFNNEILSYSISLSPNFAQTREMSDKLFKVIPANTKPILHSDQGSIPNERIPGAIKGK